MKPRLWITLLSSKENFWVGWLLKPLMILAYPHDFQAIKPGTIIE